MAKENGQKTNHDYSNNRLGMREIHICVLKREIDYLFEYNFDKDKAKKLLGLYVSRIVMREENYLASFENLSWAKSKYEKIPGHKDESIYLVLVKLIDQIKNPKTSPKAQLIRG